MSDTKFEFPTEIIDLPSKGLVYPEGHPLRKGNIEIKYMTAREEDILASQSLIKKGVVLDKLFESIVVEKGVDINDIFIGDKNAILLATRVMGYGADYTVEVTDPFTLEAQSVTIDLGKVKTKDFDEKSLNGENLYKFKLPKSGKELEFKLLTHGDEAQITNELQALERLYKGKGEKSFDVTTRLKYMILAVDGSEETKEIREFVDNRFLARDSREFRKHIEKISPDVDMTFYPKDVEEGVSIPIGVTFLWPDANI